MMVYVIDLIIVMRNRFLLMQARENSPRTLRDRIACLQARCPTFSAESSWGDIFICDTNESFSEAQRGDKRG